MYRKPARLDISNDLNYSRNVFLSGDIIRVGRNPENELVLSEPHISRYHSHIIRQKGNYALVDLGSKTGTFVNGKKLQIDYPHTLQDKDLISIGNFRIHYFDKAFLPTEISNNLTCSLPSKEIPIELILTSYLDLTIGRDLENDFVISHPKVSRFHAKLELKDGAFYIRDQLSTNGTFVNGNRLTKEHQLLPGDIIRIGSCNLVLNIDSKSTGTNIKINNQLNVTPDSNMAGNQQHNLLNINHLSNLVYKFMSWIRSE